jgi:hypothetical protein
VWISGIVLYYFLFMNLILFLVNVSRIIRAACVYLLFMLSIGMSVVLRYWPKGHA